MKRWLSVTTLGFTLLLSGCFTGGGSGGQQSGRGGLPVDTRILGPQLLERDPVGYYELSWVQRDTDTRSEVIPALTNLMNQSASALEKLQYAMSLHSLAAIDDRALTQAYYVYARELITEGKVGVALAMIGDGGLDVNYLTNDQLKFFLDTANQHRLMHTTRRLIQEGGRRQVVASQDARWVNQNRRPHEWLDAVGTVSVDGGFVIDRGSVRRAGGSGSGFFIDRNGYFITNFHVIEMAVEGDRKHLVNLSVVIDTKGVRAPAKVIGYTKDADLALLKVEYEPDFAFDIATYANNVEAGQRIYALGSPLGLFNSNISTGVITNTERVLEFIASTPLGNIIQIDAAVNPGNSGGPLVNDDGIVVGVVYSGLLQFSGINFALPADLVRVMLPKMILQDAPDTPKLAVVPYADLAAFDGNRVLELQYVGLRSQAIKSGVENFGVVERVNNQSVKSVADMQIQFARRYPNTIATLRQGGKNIPIVLKSRPKYPGWHALLRDQDIALFPAFYGAQVKASGQYLLITRVYMRSSMEDIGFEENDSIVINGPFKRNVPDHLYALNVRARMAKVGGLEFAGMLLVADLRGFNWV
ncbi:S1C family serine protease [Entomospira culicis]|uniref:Serine protease n=1 Tax=Entomospira culicis TaxID=2719989 RepID=A0A968KZ67_9SPIO|nr:S1C family serine protease [Entomospira culicis]NIZ18791.1 serine protease [Entomospira culicis]NIZ69006.1 serine protease [Entomospira culicis]WDI37597.1 S1C family serine protease [Entomospira culicis]WDI39225.1 S1C family serine protease [Entomospira culicis]